MAKKDLKKSTGFSMILDGSELDLMDLTCTRSGTVNIGDMENQLLNQELQYPEEFYSRYLGLDNDDILSSKKIKYNLTVIPGNLAGIEYVKTKSKRVPRYAKILEVAHGSGTVIMQSISGSKGDVIITKMKRDQKLIVPGGYSMAFINTRQSTAVVSEIYYSEARNQTSLDDMRGLSYYVIRKNAKQEIVQNPKYRMAPDYRKVDWEKTLEKYSITLKTPIIKQILRKYDKFDWLFKEDSIKL